MMTIKAVGKRFHAAFFRFLDFGAGTGIEPLRQKSQLETVSDTLLGPAYGANFIATLEI